MIKLMAMIVGDLLQQGPCLERKECLCLLFDIPPRRLAGNQARQTLLLVMKEAGHFSRSNIAPTLHKDGGHD
jgi:hypothetical protein